MGHEQSPTEYEEATVNLSATEERKVIKGNNVKKRIPLKIKKYTKMNL